MTYELVHGNSLDVLKDMKDNSIDSIVTDPPYGIAFMGKKWDYDVPTVELWEECFRVLKPGGHLLSFAGTRTQHRMAVNIEDAGFEIRDMIAWIYGSGFPKSLDISKAIAKVNGDNLDINAADMPTAKQWEGWGTALKPAMEPITVARKSLIGTVVENVLAWGTGGVNVDGCRIEYSPDDHVMKYENYSNGRYTSEYQSGTSYTHGTRIQINTQGRWPANVMHDGSDEVLGLFPETGNGNGNSAARFFYCAKTNKQDRNDGCGGNRHPTVKPTELMRYLCKLVTPPNGIILDPFMGSGSTGKAAILENFSFIGIDMEKEYVDIAEARINYVFDMVSRNNQKEQLIDNYFSFNQQEDGEVERD